MAVSLVAAGCSSSATAGAQGTFIPPPPPVVEGLPDGEPMASYDGRFRFVVRVPGSTSIDESGVVQTAFSQPAKVELAPSGPSRFARSLSRSRAGGSDASSFWGLDMHDLDQVPPGVELVLVGGQPGYYDIDGSFVPLGDTSSRASGDMSNGASGGGDSAPTDGDNTPPADGGPSVPMSVIEADPPEFDLDTVLNGSPDDAEDRIDERLADALVAVDGVVSATPIGDGSVAVVTSRQDTLHGLNLEVVADVSLGLAEAPPDKYETYQWYLENDGTNLDPLDNPPAQVADADIDNKAATEGPSGSGVVVAVIDTGVDFSHPDLDGQQWRNEREVCGNGVDDDQNGFVDDCVGWDFGSDDDTPFVAGQNSHGTHVAGIIAAKPDNVVGIRGVAPRVTIMDLNVSGPGGMPISAVARAVRYAVDNGADVINMSLGTQPGTPEYAVLPLIEAVRYADEMGVVVVVAAGNSNVNLDIAPVYPASIDSPNLVTVGASAPDETKASFSNYGNAVDLFAPGVLVLSTVPGGEWQFMNGTSMASPVAAGVAATLVAADPDLSPREVHDQLVGSGDLHTAYSSAANPVRINHARALGLVPDEDRVDVLIGGLASATPDEVVAEITLHEPAPLVDEPYHWEATLVAVGQDGFGYGIVNHPVEFDWQHSGTTDSRGAVQLGPTGTSAVRVETELPEGVYAVMVEAVLDDDSTIRLGYPFVAGFDVASPTPETTTTQAPSSTVSSSTTTPTTIPTSSPTTSSTAPYLTTSTTQGSASTTSPTTVQPPASEGPTSTTNGSIPTSSTSTTKSDSTTRTTAVGSTTSASVPDGAVTTATTTTTTTTTRPTTTPTTGVSTSTTVPTTSSTSAPQTTAPSTTSTTTSETTVSPTSTPVTTTTAPPTTEEPDQGATFRIDSISPIQGYTGTAEYVSLAGSFPSLVNVWFGEQVADLVFFSPDWIVVAAPVRGAAGTVDVTLRSRVYGTVALRRSAYTFVDPDSGGGGSTSTTQPQTTQPSTTGTSSSTTSPTSPPTSSPTSSLSTSTSLSTPTSSPEPDQPGSSTTAPATSTVATTSTTSTTSTTPATSTTEPEPAVIRTSRNSAVGGVIEFGNGLEGVRLDGLANLDKLVRCSSNPCQVSNL